MRERQLFSGLLLLLAFLSFQKLCYCDDQTVISISFPRNVLSRSEDLDLCLNLVWLVDSRFLCSGFV